MLMTAMDAHTHKVIVDIKEKLLYAGVCCLQTFMFTLITWAYLYFR